MKRALWASGVLALLAALPAAAAPAPVDTCALVPEAAAVAAIGKLTTPPAAKPPLGSQLGGCDYGSAKGTATVTAYPADDLDGTVRRDLKKGRAKAIAGLGDKAFQTEYGVMFHPSGKPYFLGVFVMQGAEYDAVASEKLARQLKL
jgi:hypothetical protein